MDRVGPWTPAWRSTERCCTNCIDHDRCWGNVESHVAASPVWSPELWAKRSSWRDRSVVEHMKTIYGGLCERFQHPHRETNEGFVAAEARRRAELPPLDWD